jgi:hypothetical protein
MRMHWIIFDSCMHSFFCANRRGAGGAPDSLVGCAGLNQFAGWSAWASFNYWSPRLPIVKGSPGRSSLQPGSTQRTDWTRLSVAPPAPTSVRAKKECTHESNTSPCMRINLGKICVTVSIFKCFISSINLGSLQQPCN